MLFEPSGQKSDGTSPEQRAHEYPICAYGTVKGDCWTKQQISPGRQNFGDSQFGQGDQIPQNTR